MDKMQDLFLELFSWRQKLNLKTVWIIFFALAITLTPIKICFEFLENGFENSIFFLVLFGICIAALITCIFLTKIPKRNVEIKNKLSLSISSIMLSAVSLWCALTYRMDRATKYDYPWVVVVISFLLVLTCISFLLISVTYFYGKNIMAKFPFFIFLPAILFGFRMSLFLSMNTSRPDPYEVFEICFWSMFLTYYTQIFARSTESNNTKLLFIFGLPAILITLSARIHIILNFGNFSSTALASAVLEILLSVHVLITLIEAYAQNQSTNSIK